MTQRARKLTPKPRASKKRAKLGRDLDYRGQKPPADFSRFVYEVRRGKPGALEVLQDVIETYFPKQFADAKYEAKYYLGGKKGIEFVVLFNGRTARQRFMSWEEARSLTKSTSPFYNRNAAQLVRNGYLPKYEAIVWSTRTGNRISNKLRRLSRRRREPFFDPGKPDRPGEPYQTPRWYGRIRTPWERSRRP